MSSSREIFNVNCAGNLGAPEWRHAPVQLSQDGGKPLHGFPMPAKGFLTRASHLTWSYNWAQGRGRVAMSEGNIRKSRRAYAASQALCIVGIVDYWRDYLTRVKGCQDDPPPSGELRCLYPPSVHENLGLHCSDDGTFQGSVWTLSLCLACQPPCGLPASLASLACFVDSLQCLPASQGF